MSADLHIHAMGDSVTEEAIRCFFRHTLGSKYFSFFSQNVCVSDSRVPSWECAHRGLVTESDSVWVGQVSWLKAGLLEDDSFIPDPVQAVCDLIGEDLPVLTEELMEKILEAIEIPNERAPQYGVIGDVDVVPWLIKHEGQRLFTVSW